MRWGARGAGQSRHRLGVLPIQLHRLEALVVEELEEIEGVALEVHPVLAPDAAASAAAAAARRICLHLHQEWSARPGAGVSAGRRPRRRRRRRRSG